MSLIATISQSQKKLFDDKIKNKKDLDADLNEYLDILTDAAVQRNPKEFSRAKESATCIYEILESLTRHNIRSLEDTVHTLCSVMVIPIQMLEPDLKKRNNLMKELASAFVLDLFTTYMKDSAMKGSEIGKEIDRLRFLASRVHKK